MSSYIIIGGDLIIAIDGHKIISGDHLISYLEAYTTPNQTIDVTIIRDKQEMTIPVELGTRPPPN
jgi:S1-C subfamily serine protease